MESEQDVVERIDNKYDIIEFKGKGATAWVYLVKDHHTEKLYAGKVLKEKNNLFEKEIKILAKLKTSNNPYMVNLVDSGVGDIVIANKPTKTKQYLILEYAPKGELFDYIFCPKKGLQEKYSKVIFTKILKGIQICHNNGICHRDLKMQNILVDEKCNPKICDFGFATLNSQSLNERLGTPNYAAPEILSGKPYDGFKADIFSLGVVLLTLVTCKIGFIQARKNDPFYRWIIAKHYQKYWNVVQDQIFGISDQLKKLYIRMVSYRPEERPSIDQILNDEWFNEIRNLNENQLNDLETEIRDEFSKREKIVSEELRQNMETNEDSSSYMDETRGGGDDGKEYFDLSLKPKYAKTGIGMNNYIKIKGNLNPSKFMNSLANKIAEKNENCVIEESKKNLKFNVTFEEGEKEEEEIPKELKEEFAKLGIKDDDENEEEGLEKKDTVIQLKLFESVNGGHLLRFTKKNGEIEDYYKNLEKIIALTKELL